MIDVTVKRIEDFDNYAGKFFYAGKGLGVTAWGMNVAKLPPNWADHPYHNHEKDCQEEVYIVLKGDAVLKAGNKSWMLRPGMLARIGPEQKKKLTPGKNGLTFLAIGGVPGKAWKPKDRVSEKKAKNEKN